MSNPPAVRDDYAPEEEQLPCTLFSLVYCPVACQKIYRCSCLYSTPAAAKIRTAARSI